MSAPKRGSKQNLLNSEARLLVERFLKSQAERGLCRGYLQNQESHLGAFHRYLDWKKLPLQDVQPEQVREFLVCVSFLFQMLYGRRITAGALQCWRFTLGAYFGWLKDERIVESDPTRQSGYPKRWQCRLRRLPLPGFIERLLALPDEHSYVGMRDQAVFGLAATVGLSNSELANMTVRCLDLPNNRLKVHPLQSRYAPRERWVPLEPKVRRALERYLAYARPALLREPSMQAVFLTKDGKPLARHSVMEVFRDYSEKLGAKGLNCRGMKNVAALYQLRYCGRTLDELMELFGQRNVRHMRGYLAYLPEEKRRAAARRTRYHWLIDDMEFEESELSDQFTILQGYFSGAGSVTTEKDGPETLESRVEANHVGV
jgi:site-specific recombinase XerD